MQNHSKPIQLQRYQVITLIGQGGQAKIYKVYDRESSSYYAMKVYEQKQSITTSMFQLEVNCLDSLASNNIISMFNYFQAGKVLLENGQQIFRKMILLQLAGQGDLEYIMNKKILSPTFIKTIFKKMLGIVYYLNSHKIYHRDIKPANFVFDYEFNLKIIDFGLSESIFGSIGKLGGTLQYIAPQLFKGKTASLQSELFSLGVTLFIIVFKKKPFNVAKMNDSFYRCIMQKNYKKFWKGHLNENHSQQFRDESLLKLITSLLSWKPEQRPSIDEIMNLLNNWSSQKQFTKDQLRWFLKQNSAVNNQRKRKYSSHSEITAA